MKERVRPHEGPYEGPHDFAQEQRRSFFRRAAPSRMSEGLKKQREQSVANPFRRELSLADLEEERLFIRNHRGEYCHTGVVDCQYADPDFM